MARQWTPAQLAAMNTHGRTLLVSAAAGSGKTATLTERIIRRLTDPENPGDISRMLIVTFTRAAAAELRTRIFQALNEAITEHPDNRYLQGQLLRLGAAHISTIDSFFMEPVRTHFAEAGLPASFRIADEAELAPLCEQTMNDRIDAFYRKYAPAPRSDDTMFSMLENNDFADLCDALTPANQDDGLPGTLLALYAKLMTYPMGLEQLKNEAEELLADSSKDFLSTRPAVALRAYIREFCASARTFFRESLDALASDEKACKAWRPSFEYDAAFVKRLSEAGTYADVQACLQAYEPLRMGALRGQTPEQERLKNRRTDYTNEIRKKLRDKWFSSDPAAVAADMRRTARMCEVLYDLLSDYDQAITAEKRRRGICDFPDVTRCLYRLLRMPDGSPSPVALEYAASFDEVYVDEYQDVNAIQDAIFRLIGGDHRFMVGDIKQSIYSFRGADPTVFAGYRQSFQPLDLSAPVETDRSNGNGSSIFMSDNFRCDEPIIRVTNGICGHLFRTCPDSIGYTTADDLGFAKSEPDTYDAPHVQIDLLCRDTKHLSDAEKTEEAPDTQELECIHVANRVAELLRCGSRLADGTPIAPGDIAILMRTKKDIPAMTAALSRAGIPAGCDELDREQRQQDFFHGTDMTYLINLLRVLDNPDRDIPLSEALRAPFPGFSLEDLIAAREAGKGSLYAGLCALASHITEEKTAPDDTSGSAQSSATHRPSDTTSETAAQRASDFIRWLENYRALCASLTAQDILRLLGQDRHVSARSGRAFLYLYDTARSVRTGSFVGVYDFLRFFEKKIENAKSGPDESNGKSGGYVSVMTIHKSKGLEYPVVFVMRCGSPMSAGGRGLDMLFSPTCGLGMCLFNRAENRRYETLPFRTTALDIRRREREDDMRVLYVAMTRARERLYLVGTGYSSAPEPLPDGDRYAALAGNSYMSWIMGAWQAHPELSAYGDLNRIPLSSVRPSEPLPSIVVSKPGMEDERASAARRYYQHLASTLPVPTETEMLLRSLPTKVPASRMVKDMVDRCVYFSSDLLVGDESRIPDSERGFGGCDPRTADAVHESIRLLRAAGSDELELLLAESRKPTAAERGTATHLFLQFCSYDHVRQHGVDREIIRLEDEGFINARTASILDRDALHRFFESRFFAEICRAAVVRREFHFARFVPLSSLTRNESHQKALRNRTLYVQGSIDLLCEFQDGRILIADYKTDRIRPEEQADTSLLTRRLTEAYGSQLEQYSAAVRDMYGRAPDAVLIYSVPLGEALNIDLSNGRSIE